jgi:DNA-binding CsgD family transcriptional regulator
VSNVQQPAEIFPSGDIDNSFAILCGSSGVADALSLLLAQEGYKHDTNSDLVIVLDIPRGFAPVYYDRTKNYLHKIVVTWSLCPEYLDDLWDLKPNILISGDGFLLNLANTVNWARQKNQLRITRSTSSELSPNERRVLRLVAYNYSNKDISEKLNIEYQTIKNSLSAIYQKIGVSNRMEAALYYWGIRALTSRNELNTVPE